MLLGPSTTTTYWRFGATINSRERKLLNLQIETNLKIFGLDPIRIDHFAQRLANDKSVLWHYAHMIETSVDNLYENGSTSKLLEKLTAYILDEYRKSHIKLLQRSDDSPEIWLMYYADENNAAYIIPAGYKEYNAIEDLGCLVISPANSLGAYCRSSPSFSTTPNHRKISVWSGEREVGEVEDYAHSPLVRNLSGASALGIVAAEQKPVLMTHYLDLPPAETLAQKLDCNDYYTPTLKKIFALGGKLFFSDMVMEHTTNCLFNGQYIDLSRDPIVKTFRQACLEKEELQTTRCIWDYCVENNNRVLLGILETTFFHVRAERDSDALFWLLEKKRASC